MLKNKKDIFLFFRIIRNIAIGIGVFLLLFAIVVFVTVEQWATKEEGKLPVKTAVILHAINENLVPLDIEIPNFARSSGGRSTMVRENVEIPVRDGSTIRGKVFRPNGEGPYPIIMYYHGGAFLEGYGSIETHENIVRALSGRTQSIVVAVGYRVAPNYVFPTAIEDGYDALLWAYDMVDQWNGDVNKIAVAGDSAGGNIATVIAMMSRDEGGPKLTAQVLYYPLTTFQDVPLPSRNVYDSGYYLLSRSVMYLARDKYTPEQEMWSSPYTSPLEAENLAGLPPTLIITAEFDPLRDEGEAYGKRLHEFGVPVETIRYKGVMHGFISFYEVMYRGNHGLQKSVHYLKSAFEDDISHESYTVKVVDIQDGKETFRDQLEAYAMAGFLIGKQAFSMLPTQYTIIR
ncbi:alpha/beta hydrolase [Alkalihalobacterium elongatum]|uniref:alpha/beta hydrolase n=1 Tax=Alkalihalobacterium elongatum TaxID=2675466 RepID=UPI001C1F4952|nr:alpha/beta hydrolase [Alkalihalobacterium elongatum]